MTSLRRPVRLVLVRGSRLSGTQWWPQVSRIRADPQCDGWLEVVTPDLPGHGSRAGEPFTLDRAVGAVAAAVEGEPFAPKWCATLGNPSATHHSGRNERERVVLVGHSLGGYVAMAYAATYPRRLGGLVLLGCGAVPRGPGAAAYRGVAAVTERLGAARMTRVNDRVLHRLYPPDLVDDVIAGGYWFGPTRAAWHEVMSRCGPHQLRDVTCPVLVAGGTFDQLMVDAGRYARAAPLGRVQWVPRAGHLVGLDQPDGVTRMLVDFALDAADGRLGRS